MKQTDDENTQGRNANDSLNRVLDGGVFKYFYPVFILAIPIFLIFPLYLPYEIAEDTFHNPYSVIESLVEGDAWGVGGLILSVALVGFLVWSFIAPKIQTIPSFIAITSIIILSLVLNRSGLLYDVDLSTNGYLVVYATSILIFISIAHESILAISKYRNRLNS